MAYQPPPVQRVVQLASSDYDSLLAWIRMQEGIIAELEAEIERLKNPPVSTPRLFGFTIANDQKTPSTAEYTKNKSAMDWGKQQGFNTYRIFLNPTEMRNMSLGAGSLENIIAYGASLGLAWQADTMDRICKDLPLDSSLKTYCDGGARLGWTGVYINDADRKELSLETLKAYVARLRKFVTVPIYGSLMGNADIATYAAIFDRVEIQTFGSDSELANYLKIKGVLPCLDLRKPLTEEQLKAKAAIIKRNPPKDLYYYTDLNSDYVDMPDGEDEVIHDLLQALKKM